MQNSTTLIRMLSVLVALAAAGSPVIGQNSGGLIKMYTLTELSGGSGGSSKAYAINATGQTVGWLTSSDDKHAAHWHNKETTDLHGTVHLWLQHPQLFNEDYSEAYAISDADQIVGGALKSINCPPKIIVMHAYLLRPAVLTDLATPYSGDALTDFGTFGDPCLDLDSAATAVSNANHVVGWSDVDGSSAIHAFLITPVNGQFFCDEDEDCVNDLMIDLGTLPGRSDPVSAATGVNDDGQITGYSYTTSATTGEAAYHAFLLTPADTDGDGVGDLFYIDVDGDGANDYMEDLGTLGGNNSWGRDINDFGQIVGESDTDPSQTGGHFTRAFLWQNGSMTDLGTLGGNHSAASAVNDDGDIVGWAENADGQRRAFILEDGEMKDLNDLLYLLNEDGITTVPGIVLTEARDINEDGLIAGWGTIRGSAEQGTRGFLLTPIEVDPSTLEDDDENGADPDTGTAVDGTAYEGEPISGTPGNLAGGTTPDDSGDGSTESGGGPTPTGAPALCGLGTFALLPLALVALCWMKANTAGGFRTKE